MENKTNKQKKILEIRGILSVLSNDYGQSIASKDRLEELNKFLRELK